MQTLIFDKYAIIRRLAVGGMGEIFLARQIGAAGFARLVILKSLLPELAEQERFVAQFLDEARVAATLNHPNIVAIYEVGLWEGTYYIAMEYIHGFALSTLLSRACRMKVTIPPCIAARIVHDAAQGLDHAHHVKGVSGKPLHLVHRDVSPQNIMVRDDGHIKTLDFGIAKAADRASRTATNEIKGKLGYMSPEQVMGKALDGRSDQYSLGVVFWELCTCQHLFPTSNPGETVRKILAGDVRRPSSVIGDLPAEIEDVIVKMLELKPDKRFERCRDAAQALREILRSQPAETSEQQVAEFVSKSLKMDLPDVDAAPAAAQENFVVSLGSLEDAAELFKTTSTCKIDGASLPSRVPQLLESAVGASSSEPMAEPRGQQVGKPSGCEPGVVVVEIKQEEDMVAVRGAARDVAREMGFDRTSETKIATAVSEVARNIFRYVGKGTIAIQAQAGTRSGIRIEAWDEGPGIGNLEEVLAGDYQSTTGMGMGLAACKKLMDDFYITSDGNSGTHVIMLKYLTRP